LQAFYCIGFSGRNHQPSISILIYILTATNSTPMAMHESSKPSARPSLYFHFHCHCQVTKIC